MIMTWFDLQVPHSPIEIGLWGSAGLSRDVRGARGTQKGKPMGMHRSQLGQSEGRGKMQKSGGLDPV